LQLESYIAFALGLSPIVLMGNLNNSALSDHGPAVRLAWMLVAYSALVAAIALLPKALKEARTSLFLVAGGLVGLVAPYGYDLVGASWTPSLTPWLLLLSSVVGGGICWVRRFRDPILFAGVATFLAAVQGGISFSPPPGLHESTRRISALSIATRPQELAFWVAMLGVVVFLGFATGLLLSERGRRPLQPSVFAIGLLLLGRISYLGGAYFSARFEPALFALIACLLAVCLELLFWVGRKRTDFGVTFLATLLIGIVYLAIIVSPSDTLGVPYLQPVWWHESIVLVLLAIIVGMLAALRDISLSFLAFSDEFEGLGSGSVYTFTLLGWLAIIGRLGYATLPHLVSVEPHLGFVTMIGFGAAGVALTSLLDQRKEPGITALLGCFAGLLVLAANDTREYSAGALASSVLIGATVVAIGMLIRLVGPARGAANATTLAGTILLLGEGAEFAQLSLARSVLGVGANAAISLVWTALGIGLLASGFAVKRVELRFASFSVFALTVSKVLLVDLAALESWLRVLILMALGSMMLLAGYIYVRRRDTSKTPESPASDPLSDPPAAQNEPRIE
jgi:hypothetical protein